jgi:pyruvate formate lyase activating enzyme
MTTPESLRNILHERVTQADPALVESLGDRALRCYACGHRCRINDGREGVCRIRFNEGGVLYVPYGYVAGLQVDPIEKKPFYHVLPGSDALSFGMLGCDFHCSFCQNWISSQVLRDDNAVAPIREVTPEELVAVATRYGAPAAVSTYNEPLITSEWAAAVFRPARAAGLLTGYVSNGHATPEVIDFLEPIIDMYKVDLKCFQERSYRGLGGKLQAVLDTIRDLSSRGIWVEVVTLLVPGFNDDPQEVRDMADFLVSVSRDIPWHITAFHPDYNMLDTRRTSADDLRRAYDIGREAGLRFVYPGNLHGQLDSLEDTHCPQCRATLVRRTGFHVHECRVGADGSCPDCGEGIPGIWARRVPESQ